MRDATKRKIMYGPFRTKLKTQSVPRAEINTLSIFDSLFLEFTRNFTIDSLSTSLACFEEKKEEEYSKKMSKLIETRKFVLRIASSASVLQKCELFLASSLRTHTEDR